MVSVEGRLWVWVGGCRQFVAAMTGLALEKEVGDGLGWTVELRFASSDNVRTVTFRLDGLL